MLYSSCSQGLVFVVYSQLFFYKYFEQREQVMKKHASKRKTKQSFEDELDAALLKAMAEEDSDMEVSVDWRGAG